MLTPHLRHKFSDLYQTYGLGATKNMLLIVQLLLLGRTTSLWKLKDSCGKLNRGLVLNTPTVQPTSHYRRLIRFFDDWSEDQTFRLDLQRRALGSPRRSSRRVVSGLGPGVAAPSEVYPSAAGRYLLDPEWAEVPLHGPKRAGRFGSHPHLLKTSMREWTTVAVRPTYW